MVGETFKCIIISPLGGLFMGRIFNVTSALSRAADGTLHCSVLIFAFRLSHVYTHKENS